MSHDCIALFDDLPYFVERDEESTDLVISQQQEVEEDKADLECLSLSNNEDYEQLPFWCRKEPEVFILIESVLEEAVSLFGHFPSSVEKENFHLSIQEIKLHASIIQVEQEKSLDTTLQNLHQKVNNRNSTFVILRGCPIRCLASSEATEVPEVVLVPKYEDVIKQEAVFGITAKGDQVQLTFPVHGNNMHDHFQSGSRFLCIFYETLQQSIEHLLVFHVFSGTHNHVMRKLLIKKGVLFHPACEWFCLTNYFGWLE